MSGKRGAKNNPYKRYQTRHLGISYRKRATGERTYFVANGSRHLKVDGGEQEALRVQAELRSKRARGMRVTPPTTTFRTVAESWYARGCARWERSTQDGYRTALDLHVLPVFGERPIAAITTDAIAAFIADRREDDAAESYIALNLRPLNGALKLALRDGLIATNPMAALLPEERPKPRRRKRRTWTPTEIKALVDAARELGSRVGQIYDYTPIIILAVYTGMRIGELLGLRWSDVDLKEGVVRVRWQLDRKTRTLVRPKTAAGIRDIPIPASLVGYLRRLRLASSYSLDDHHVFSSKNGAPLDHGNVRKRGFAAAVERAGLNRPGERALTMHDLRHAFASVVAHHGIASVDLAVLMGHADARVTDLVYVHPYNEVATAARFREVIDAAITEHVAEPI